MIARNHTGHRIGEGHHRAKLSDAQVKHMRAMHEVAGLGIASCAKYFQVPFSTARDVLRYYTRGSA